MSDSRLLFRRGLRGLEPADERAEAWLRRVPRGTTLAIDPPKRPRNVRFHALYWALVTLVHQHLDEEKAAMYPDPETLHRAIKIAAGLRTEFVLSNGTVGFIPGSIAFAAMGEDEFAAFFDKVCELIVRYWLPGVESEALRMEVEEMVGARIAA